MTTTNNIVRIFMMPRPSSYGPVPMPSCCGSIGQTTKEIQRLRTGIKKAIDCQIEVYDVTSKHDMEKYPSIRSLMSSSGAKALPVIMFNDEIVSIGNPWPGQAIATIKEKIYQI